MLPRLIVDRSFLQMLGAELMEELTLWFDVITTPTLFREIIGTLSKINPPKAGKRIPIVVVKSLATSLEHAHGSTPVSFKKLVIGELDGRPVEMNGVTIPVDSSAVNVHSSRGWLVVDGTIEQRLWARWARGDFNGVDELMSQTWRAGVDALDMRAIGESAKSFVGKNIGIAHDVAELVPLVDALLANPDRGAQARSVGILLGFLREDPRYGARFALALASNVGLTLATYAPYAFSVLRLYLVFVSALALGLIKRDSNSVADLQYLFYAPFVGGFASNDTLHKRLFPATTGKSLFAEGEVLKADLADRLTWRQGLTPDEWAKHREEYSIYPVERPDSLVNAIWDVSMQPRAKWLEALKARKPDQLRLLNDDPKFKRMIQDMHRAVDESKTGKRVEDAPWPFGPKPEDGTPL